LSFDSTIERGGPPLGGPAVVTSIVPVTFSVASSMTKIRFGHPPM
jgi:hypothetical protein